MHSLAPFNDSMGSNGSGLSFNVLSQYPVHPDVTFKHLAFYDVLAELLKPTSLAPVNVFGPLQEKELLFCLRPQDVSQLNSSSDVQVQLRIGILVSNCELEDDFPRSVCLKVNHKAVLSNAFAIKNPVDITIRVKISTTESQHVYVAWPSNNSLTYVMGVFLVRKNTSYTLVKRLVDNGVRSPKLTTAMIKDMLYRDRDSEIATMRLRASLICPLGKNKIILPCRPITCTHLQCFDAHAYIQMNENKPTWMCPVCNKPAELQSLTIDGFFLNILNKVPFNCRGVQFYKNQTLTPFMSVIKVAQRQEITIQDDSPKVSKQSKPELEFRKNNSYSPVIPVKGLADVSVTTSQGDTSKVKNQVEIISLSDSDTEDLVSDINRNA